MLDKLAPVETAKGLVYHMRVPSAPSLRFEWHPQAAAVFCITGTPPIAELIVPEVHEQHYAKVAACAYVNGFNAGSKKLLLR